MTLAKRITVFAGLWLVAGVLCAVFSEGSFEAGESELLARLWLVYLVPFIAGAGVAFTLVQGHYDTWQQREHCEAVVAWVLLAFFVAHAAVALTRRSRRQFMILSGIQVLFLVTSVFCVLYFFHYDASHGRG
jgi:cytochrome bd-type quinol oxidase subunit 2